MDRMVATDGGPVVKVCGVQRRNRTALCVSNNKQNIGVIPRRPPVATKTNNNSDAPLLAFLPRSTTAPLQLIIKQGHFDILYFITERGQKSLDLAILGQECIWEDPRRQGVQTKQAGLVEEVAVKPPTVA